MGQDNRETPLSKLKRYLPPDMSEQDFHELATYNGEVARGLVHTAEWKAKMAVFQERWNRWAIEQQERAKTTGRL